MYCKATWWDERTILLYAREHHVTLGSQQLSSFPVNPRYSPRTSPVNHNLSPSSITCFILISLIENNDTVEYIPSLL